jgi:hypothetical protein
MAGWDGCDDVGRQWQRRMVERETSTTARGLHGAMEGDAESYVLDKYA